MLRCRTSRLLRWENERCAGRCSLFGFRAALPNSMKKTLMNLLLLLPACLNAQVSVNTSLTSLAHSWSPSLSLHMSEDFLVSDYAGGAPAPSFNANLSPSNTFSWTVSAPSGYALTLSVPSTATTAFVAFNADWYGTAPYGTLTNASSTSVTFSGLNGTFTGNSVHLRMSSTGDQVNIQGALGVQPGTTISFTSMTISADYSNITNRTGWGVQHFDPASFFLSYQVYLSASSHSSSDPGPFASLVAIPEPSTYALAAGLLGMVVAVARRYRSPK